MTESRESKLLTNAFLLLIANFLPKLSSLITIPILTAFLTKEELGRYDLLLISVSLVLPIITIGISTAVFRFLIDVRDKEKAIKEIVSTAFVFVFCEAVALVLTFCFFFPQLHFYEKFAVSLFLISELLLMVSRPIARGLDNNKVFSFTAGVNTVVRVILIITFVWFLRMGLLGLLISLFISTFVSWIILSIKLKLVNYLNISFFKFSTLKNMLRYSWPMVPNGLSMWVMRLSDRMIIAAFMGVSWTGVYAVACKFPQIMHLVQQSFILSWQENASVVSNDTDVSEYYSSIFRKTFDFSAGLLGLMICSVPILFKIFIFGNYDDAFVQVPILFLAEFVFIIATFFGGIYVAFKRTKSVGITTFFAAICNLLINFIAIKDFGLYAASVSTLISYFLLFIYRIRDVQKFVSIKYDVKHMIFVFFLLSIETFLCILRIDVVTIINIVLGISVFYLLNGKEIKDAWHKIKNKRKKNSC